MILKIAPNRTSWGKERFSMKVPKSKRHAGQPWSAAQERRLGELARGNTPTGVMSLKLGRSQDAVRSKASELGVSLKPTNKSPYNRRKAS
jgi:hypothetical protein